MVRRLHAAGLEVLLDVVYNHTPETDARGATWSMRGLDDGLYYRADPHRPGEYVDFTGCGNSLDTREPRVLELVLDSLRYWVSEMHVDGFRFDLAPALARDSDGAFDAGARFFEQIARDAVLAPVKLIAEPWDLGPGGDCTGAFPRSFAEWNDRYRDCRSPLLARQPRRAIVVLRAPGGFGRTLRVERSHAAGEHQLRHAVTTVSPCTTSSVYARKHNEANGEDNRDGRARRDQWNWGVEGRDEGLARGARCASARKRNLIATLALSQGVPMLSHGDETRAHAARQQQRLLPRLRVDLGRLATR